MCPHEEKLTAWLLGDLPPGEREAVTRHLDGCASCRSVRDELSQVLVPLRSGLEKDRRLRLDAGTDTRAQPDEPRSFWFDRHEGLRRLSLVAASLVIFFTLFTLIQLQTLNDRRPEAPGPDITFLMQDTPVPASEPAPAAAPEPARDAAAAPAPALESTPVATAPARRDTLAELDAEAAAKAAPPAVALPAVPAPEPNSPRLNRLPQTPAESAKQSAPAAAAAQPPFATAPAATKVKTPTRHAREVEKLMTSPTKRPTAEMAIKPVRLAGAVAPTNAPTTNSVPTNAISPTVRSSP